MQQPRNSKRHKTISSESMQSLLHAEQRLGRLPRPKPPDMHTTTPAAAVLGLPAVTLSDASYAGGRDCMAVVVSCGFSVR